MNKKFRLKKVKKTRLKDALFDKKSLDKLISLTDQINKLDNEENSKDLKKDGKLKSVEELRKLKSKFLKSIQFKLKEKLGKNPKKILKQNVQKNLKESQIDVAKSKVEKIDQPNVLVKESTEFKLSSNKEHSLSISSDSFGLSVNGLSGADNLTPGPSKERSSIFAIENAEQIDNFLKKLRIDEFLNKIKFIDFSLNNTIKNYTRLEFIEFENKLKKKRIELDIYLFAFKHFYELIWKKTIDAIESIDLISKWITIKDEKIRFWSKLNQSVYMKIEVEPDNYDLVIKDESNNLIRFTKNNFHQIIKTFANKIITYEFMLKSMKAYIDKIDEKRHLINLNLVNLFNFNAKKYSFKNLDKHLKD